MVDLSDKINLIGLSCATKVVLNINACRCFPSNIKPSKKTMSKKVFNIFEDQGVRICSGSVNLGTLSENANITPTENGGIENSESK